MEQHQATRPRSVHSLDEAAVWRAAEMALWRRRHPGKPLHGTSIRSPKQQSGQSHDRSGTLRTRATIRARATDKLGGDLLDQASCIFLYAARQRSTVSIDG